MITKTCKQCGQEFEVYPSRKDRKFCSSECYHKWMEGQNNPRWKSRVTKTCKQCGKGFEVLPSRVERRDFCSPECSQKWHTGENHPFYGKGRPDMKGENNPMYGKTHSEETIEKIRKASIERVNDPKMLRKMLSIRRPTSIEKKIIKIIEKHNFPFKYVGNGGFILEGKNPDFVDTDGSKRIIEVFGDHWHEPEEEQERKELFSKYGFDTLVLWGHNIHDLPNEEIVNKIKNFGGG